MTLPRQVLPGATYLVTRRCTQRHFLLKPSPIVNQIFQYCVAAAAQSTDVRVHALCVMSNHWHAVVTDPRAQLPEFLRIVHKLTANCINSLYGRAENLWATEQTSVVRLLSDHDVLDMMAYTVANPTSAGLVEDPGKWPGLLLRDFGETRNAERPSVFFRANGRMAVTIPLVITRPQILAERTDSELQNMLAEAVRKRVRKTRSRFRQEHRKFLGPQRVLRQRTDSRPRSPRNPANKRRRFAASDHWRQLHAQRHERSFLTRYRSALQLLSAGMRPIFPPGTYALRVRMNVVCAPA